MKLGEIARRFGWQLEGNPEVEISGAAGVDFAEPGHLTFLSNPRYRRAAENTRASALLIGKGAELARDPKLPGLALIRSENPYLDFAKALELLCPPPKYAPSIHPTAVISPSARIGKGGHVGPFCYLDDGVEIGENAVLHSFVVIYRNARIGDNFFAHAHAVVREGCRLGNRVTLHSGAIIGSDGFGFAPRGDGGWKKLQQTGITVIEDDVEVQANACIDRATVGETHIGRGSKIDDLVLVGHSCKVGEDALLCGQVGLAGSSVIGNRCVLAGQVGVAGHLTIGEGAVITSKSGVPGDVPPRTLYSGYPAVENRQWLKNAAALNRLPELHKTVRMLQKELERLQSQLK